MMQQGGEGQSEGYDIESYVASLRSMFGDYFADTFYYGWLLTHGS